jgi:serine/threonine protein kinase
MTGKTISHYEVLEKLGGGGMGVVYKARDTRLGRLVALKFLPEEMTRDSQALARFQREARAASALNHPNICTIHDVGEFEEKPFLVMEYLEGQTLKHYIQGKSLSPSDLIEFWSQLADALDAAHSKGILHRDIKPQNIFITNRNQAKILDFGLAKLKEPQGEIASQFPTSDASGSLTHHGSILGTASHLSPEQISGKELDARSDLFSLGVVFYEMTTGRVPFQGENLYALFDQILNKTPADPSILNPELPPDLAQIIHKTLEKQKELRYQTAADLLADLKRLKRDTVVEQKKQKQSGEKSIAVLPFVNMSPDPENEYFSDGLTEEIIATLSKIKSLRVISRTSAMRYKGTDKPLRQVAEELNVQHVLEGSVRKHGSNLRITAQLIDVLQDAHLWAEKYRGTMEDIFEIQEKVAEEISETLRVKLSAVEEADLKKRSTASSEAYQLYLKGRYHWHKRMDEAFRTGLEYFQRAIQIDPTYALAYVGVADTYNIMALYGFLAPKEAFPNSKSAVLKALSIDHQLAEAHTSLAWVLHFYDWDWQGTEREYKQAIQLRDNYSSAHHFYSDYLESMGRVDDAIAELIRAIELDPFSMPIHTGLAWSYTYARRYDLVIEQCKKAIALDEHFPAIHILLGESYSLTGEHEKAIQQMEIAASLWFNSVISLSYLAYALARAGRTEEAREFLVKLDQLSEVRYVDSFLRALVHIALNETEVAFEWLRKACDERSSWLIYMKVDPMLDPLRSDRRFEEILNIVGLNRTPADSGRALPR